MSATDRWQYLSDLDEQLLKGVVVLSEWCSLVIREADLAFVGEANLATTVMCVSAIETYLRAEYGDGSKSRLYDLIENSPIESSLKSDIHKLRKFRNRFVHINKPWDDEYPLEKPEALADELKRMAFKATRALRTTIYENLWI